MQPISNSKQERQEPLERKKPTKKEKKQERYDRKYNSKSVSGPSIQAPIVLGGNGVMGQCGAHLSRANQQFKISDKIYSNINGDLPLSKRALEFVSPSNEALTIASLNANKNTQVTKVTNVIKQLINVFVTAMNLTWEGQRNINISINDSIEKSILIISNNYRNLIKCKLVNKYQEIKEAEIRKALSEFGFSFDDERMNGLFCFHLFHRMFNTYFQYDKKRDQLSFPSTACENNDDEISQNMNGLIDKVIANLEKSKQENCLRIFRIMLDPGIEYKSKFMMTRNFFGFLPGMKSEANIMSKDFFSESYNQSGDISEFRILLTSNAMLEERFSDFVARFHKLDILLDDLKKMKEAPKTYDNMKIFCNFLNENVKLFEEHIPGMQRQIEAVKNQALKGELEKNYAEGFSKCDFYREYFVTCSFLNGIVSEFNELLKCRRTSDITKKAMQNERKNKFEAINESDDPNTIISSEDDIIFRTVEISEEILESPIKAVKEEVLGLTEKTEEPFIFDPGIPAQIIENEDNDSDEVKNLMDILENVFAKDREEKRISKPSRENEENVVIETKLEKKKLSPNAQERLNQLFNFEKITEHDIGLIIKDLGGRIEGGGKGRIIHWKDSNRKGGEFEVKHGCDAAGNVTSKYCERLIKKILLAKKNGWIPVDFDVPQSYQTEEKILEKIYSELK